VLTICPPRTSRSIVAMLETRIADAAVPRSRKLPLVYLVDSILKNIGEPYISLFGAGVSSWFPLAYETMDSQVCMPPASLCSQGDAVVLTSFLRSPFFTRAEICNRRSTACHGFCTRGKRLDYFRIELLLPCVVMSLLMLQWAWLKPGRRRL
jgi:hypothetical protein